MIKFNEATSIRKTYEQIVKRLKDERVGFDNQLAAIERTLKAKSSDYEELRLLSGDATHAKDLAAQELEKVQRIYQKNRTQREKELKDRQLMVKQKEMLLRHVEERDAKRKDLLMKSSGDLSLDEENKLKEALAVNKMQENLVSSELDETKEKLEIFEKALTQYSVPPRQGL